jgi:hypothetical protein
MDGAIYHPITCGCDGNDMEVRAKMVQDELLMIVASIHEETIVVVPKLTTSNNVPTCPWHNVQSMAQLLLSQPVIIMWGILMCLKRQGHAHRYQHPVTLVSKHKLPYGLHVSLI